VIRIFVFFVVVLIFGFVFSGLVTSSVNVKSSGFSLREQSSLWTSYNKRVILKSSFSVKAASVEGKFICFLFLLKV